MDPSTIQTRMEELSEEFQTLRDQLMAASEDEADPDARMHLIVASTSAANAVNTFGAIAKRMKKTAKRFKKTGRG